MNLFGVSRGISVFLCSGIAAFAGVSPQIHIEPNSYSFSSGVYYADWDATNAEITIGAVFGNPWMTGAVGYFTQDGTAVGGIDYTPVSGSVGVDAAHLGKFNVPLLPSCSPTNKTVELHLTPVVSTDLLGVWGATLVIRAAPLSLALPLPLTPLTFKLTACTEGEKLDAISSRTNHTRTGTSLTQVTQSTLNTVSFGSGDLLALLQNSYGTNFPNGAQIAFRFGHLYVVDVTGNNIVMDPAGVLAIHFGENFVSGLETQTAADTGALSSGNSTESVTARTILSYDDSGMVPADGTSTKFDFSGLCVVKVSTNLKNNFSSVSVNFQGTGDGLVRNQQTILNGTISGKVSGTQSP